MCPQISVFNTFFTSHPFCQVSHKHRMVCWYGPSNSWRLQMPYRFNSYYWLWCYNEFIFKIKHRPKVHPKARLLDCMTNLATFFGRVNSTSTRPKVRIFRPTLFTKTIWAPSPWPRMVMCLVPNVQNTLRQNISSYTTFTGQENWISNIVPLNKCGWIFWPNLIKVPNFI